MEIQGKRKIDLSENWEFCLSGENSHQIENGNQLMIPRQYFKANVPGTIHTDLLNHNLIEEPFYSDNELRLNWIPECDWIYQTEFDHENESDQKVELVFEGLDTVAEIFLNGDKLGETNNMFLCYRYDVTSLLITEKNKLKIIFRSPIKYAKELESKYGKLQVALNSERAYIRKAQYSFGWDWGPSFPTCGIWRDVYLEEVGQARIENIKVQTDLISTDQAKVIINTSISDNQNSELVLQVSLSNENKSYHKKVNIVEEKESVAEFIISDPKLWWPNGEGEQNLYELSVKLLNQRSKVIDEEKKKIGIRTVELITSDNYQSAFKFRVNGKDIFCKGANWIPADSFLPRVENSKYSKLLSLAKDANMNMIRVWGGGIYENDEFYDLCDKLGLLVWQDFMFACGAYPEHELFIENVKKEVTQNVLRLQSHPSIAIWCGNNENEWLWFQWNGGNHKEMPGSKIYSSVIPEIMKILDPGRPYWQSSPFGFDKDPNSSNSGNTHQWGIWSSWIDYTEVKNDKSLFVTEFGFQGTSNKDTFEKFIPEQNRKVHDNIFEFHNKQIEGPERIIKFLSGHLPLTCEWDDFLYLSQLNQGFALKTCLEHWITNERTMGSVIWQLNDCWPVTSWALVDSELKPKLSYHFVKNTFSGETLSFHKTKGLDCRIDNRTNNEFNRSVKLSFVQSATGVIIKEKIHNITLQPNSFEVIENVIDEDTNLNNVILMGTLYDSNGNQIHRNYCTTNRWKHISLSPKLLETSIEENGNKKYVKLISHTANFFIDLYYPNITFSERGIILLPGEEVKLEINGKNIASVNSENVRCFALNDYLNEN